MIEAGFHGVTGRHVDLVIVGSVVSVLAIVVAALVGEPWLGSYAARLDLLRGVSTPDATHWLGTDILGRDVLARLIVGARSAVVGPALVAGGTVLLGLVAGLVGRRHDIVSIFRWVATATRSFPSSA